jgi:prepilin-type N-terminal cleavage/methylation domain-containing protein
MIKRLKSNKGLTLVELLIGMAMLGILITIVGAIFSSIFRVQNTVIELAELNNMLDNAANPIMADLQNAAAPLINLHIDNRVAISLRNAHVSNDCSILPPDPCPLDTEYSFICFNSCDADRDTIYTVNADGVLLKNGNSILPGDFYKGKRISFTVEEESPGAKAYILTLTISDRDNEFLTSRQYTARPFRINQHNSPPVPPPPPICGTCNEEPCICP